jgi:hypothetical protein
MSNIIFMEKRNIFTKAVNHYDRQDRARERMLHEWFSPNIAAIMLVVTRAI